MMASRTMRAWLLVLVACVAMCPAGRAARADDGPATTRALELGRDGLRLFSEQRWTEARARFEAADRLSHSPVFVLYVARSLAKEQRFLDARAAYRSLLAERLPDDAPPPWTRAHADGGAELAQLESAIPSLVLTAEGPIPVTSTVDGRPATLDTEIDVDPGDHTVVARFGARTFEAKVKAVAGVRRSPVVIRFPPVAQAAPPPMQENESGSWVPGAVLLGVGGATVAVGAVLGGVALAKEADVRDRCGTGDTTCPESKRNEVEPDYDEAVLLGNVSTGLLVGGSVIGAVGVVLLVVLPGADRSAPSASLALTMGGATVHGRF